ncbi:MAG TPA: family 16 glycoside hydrolase, partial [Acidobacteriota bacterium]|nr:family 16 glycoside hydrolase [Acidobacteriota bacterium]
AGASFAEAITSPAGAAAARVHVAADSERPAGEWNSADIVCREGEISVTINGVAQNRVTGASLHAGRIGLQFEGTPFAVRAVRIEPLAAGK